MKTKRQARVKFNLAQSDTVKGNLVTREYLVTQGNKPIDRFKVFRVIGDSFQWDAWTSDTMSETTKQRRREFATTL